MNTNCNELIRYYDMIVANFEMEMMDAEESQGILATAPPPSKNPSHKNPARKYETGAGNE